MVALKVPYSYSLNGFQRVSSARNRQILPRQNMQTSQRWRGNSDYGKDELGCLWCLASDVTNKLMTSLLFWGFHWVDSIMWTNHNHCLLFATTYSLLILFFRRVISTDKCDFMVWEIRLYHQTGPGCGNMAVGVLFIYDGLWWPSLASVLYRTWTAWDGKPGDLCELVDPNSRYVIHKHPDVTLKGTGKGGS